MSTSTPSQEAIDQLREPAFVVAVLLGTFLFAFGGAFLVIGIAINTAPPAPYVDPTDRQLLIGLSLVTMVVGAVMIRLGARIVGW